MGVPAVGGAVMAAGAGGAVAVAAPVVAAMSAAYAANKILFSPMCEKVSLRYQKLGCQEKSDFPCYTTLLSIATYCGGESVTGWVGAAFIVDVFAKMDWSKHQGDVSEYLKYVKI